MARTLRLASAWQPQFTRHRIRPVTTMPRPMRYATTSDGVRIAYMSLGDGPPVVFASNIFGDLPPTLVIHEPAFPFGSFELPGGCVGDSRSRVPDREIIRRSHPRRTGIALSEVTERTARFERPDAALGSTNGVAPRVSTVERLSTLFQCLRKRADYHKRLMLLGTIALIPAATTRPFMPGSLPNTLMMFGLPEVMFLMALWVHDRCASGRLHVATRWGGGLLLVTAVSRTLVAGTDAWLAVAKLLLR